MTEVVLVDLKLQTAKQFFVYFFVPDDPHFRTPAQQRADTRSANISRFIREAKTDALENRYYMIGGRHIDEREARSLHKKRKKWHGIMSIVWLYIPTKYIAETFGFPSDDAVRIHGAEKANDFGAC